MLNRVSNSTQILQNVSSQTEALCKKVEQSKNLSNKDLEKFINTLEGSGKALQRSVVPKEPPDAKVINRILSMLKNLQNTSSFQVLIGSVIVTLGKDRWSRSVKNFEQILKKLKRGERVAKAELDTSSHQGQ